jgi:DNA-binding protein HU-beta
MNKLNKNDLIEMVAEKAHISKRDSREALECALELLEDALVHGREVNLTNFGVFEAKTREGRVGTHPKEHTKIDIQPSTTVTFRVSKSLKSRLNK